MNTRAGNAAGAVRDRRARMVLCGVGVALAGFVVSVSASLMREAPALVALEVPEATPRVVDPTLAEDAEVSQAQVVEAVDALVEADPEPKAGQGPVIVADEEIRWFNGRAVRPARTITMTVTAYSPDARSCGEYADGRTATMHPVTTNRGKLVAADPSVLGYGSLLTVPGYDEGRIVPVLDCGGAIKGNRLDVLFPTHEAALQWGVRELEVVVWEPVDGGPVDDPRKLR